MAYLSVANNTAFQFGTGDFTIEFWVNMTVMPISGATNQFVLFDDRPASTEGLYPTLYIDSTGAVKYYTDSSDRITSTTLLVTATWYHIALVRISGSTKLYIGGTQSGSTYTDSNNYTSDTVYIGASYWNSATLYNTFKGNLTNYRITKGVGVYTNTFTPSTTPLTATQSAGTNINAITGTQTSLLTCQSAGFQDNSTNRFTINFVGTTKINPGIPFTAPTTASSYSMISAGGSFGAILNNNGQAFTFGVNTTGQLGSVANPAGTTTLPNLSSPVQLGTSYYTNSPVQIGNNSWSQISSGQKHIVALRSDNTLYAWGYNNLGQLGSADLVHRSSPTQIGTSSWSNISSGITHTVAVRNDGGLFVWGNNPTGQLGTGDVVHRSSPVQVGTSSWSQVSAGYTHSLAIRSDGRLFGFGNYAANEFTQTISYSFITAGTSTAMALRSDRTLWAWGINTNGRLGLFDTINRSSPVQVGASSWTQVVNANDSSLAIRLGGGLFVWGNNSVGQLGGVVPVGTAVSSPVQLGASSWTVVGGAASQANYAIRTDNRLFAWGNNVAGQLGLGDALHRSSPVQVGTSSWSQITGGNSFTVGILSDGSLYTWGLNTSGQLGQGDAVTKSSPVQITSIITENDQSTYASYLGATIYSWAQISSGSSHSVGLRSDKTLWTWGLNAAGQLGTNDILNSNYPVRVGTSSWLQVAAGQTHTVAVRNDGGLFVWGDNTSGQLGLAVITHRSSPTQVGTSSWSQVSAGGSHTIATKSDNTIFTWGGNGAGQLGTNDVTLRSSPVQIGLAEGADLTDGYYSVSFNGTQYLSIDQNSAFSFGTGDLTVEGWMYFTNAGSSAPQSLFGVGTGSSVFDIRWYTGLNQWQVTTNSNSGSSLGGSAPSNNTWYHVAMVRSGNSIKLYINGIATGTTVTYTGSLGINTSAATIGASDTGPTNLLIGNISNLRITKGQALYTANFTPPTSPLTTTSQGATESNVVLLTCQSGTFKDNSTNNFTVSSVAASISSLAPFPDPLKTLFASSVEAGNLHTGIVATTGLLWAWGNSASGQVGDGNIAHRSNPVQLTSIQTLDDQTSYLAIVGGTAPSWSQISMNGNHSLGIRTDGSLWAWGLNTLGQLGDTTLTAKSYPVKIGNSSWSQVITGSLYSAAIRTDGRLFVWGSNINGQLGINSVQHRSSPVQVGTSSWSQVSAGISYTVAIRTDGGLFVWGSNTNGQLGISSSAHRSSPVQIGTSSWSSISAGLNYTFGVLSNGLLFTWGLNTVGTLGTNDVISRSSPVQIGTNSWSTVNATGAPSALDISKTLYTWGSNTNGSIGDGTTVHRSSPVQVTSIATEADENLYRNVSGITYLSWAQVSTGLSHTLAIRSDGALYGWGLNAAGQVGDTTITNKQFPIKIGNSSWAYVSAGYTHSTAIRTDGGLFVWGNNATGQLGTVDVLHRSSPVQIGASSWSQVSAGGSHTSALLSNNTVYVWGGNAAGQLGLNDATLRSSPVQLGSISATSVMSGRDHTLLINSQNLLFAWGNSANGQVGDGLAVHRSSPVQITSLLTETNIYDWVAYAGGGQFKSWSQLSIGTSFSLAIDNIGQLYGWGTNTSGQLGTNNTVNASKPIIIGTSSWSQVNAGGSHAAAIRLDGLGFIWGNNTVGQLGFNDRIHRSSPTQIGTGSWTTINAGVSTTLAIDANKSLYVWGGNTNGSLGINDVAHRSSPVQVGTSSWSQVAADQNNSIAIKNDGTLWTWGNGTNGELGQGAAVSRSSPVQINSLGGVESLIDSYAATIGYAGTIYNSWIAIAGSVSTTWAIRSDGMLFAWGANESGQLGDNTTTNTSVPIMIGNSSWTAIAAGAGSATTHFALAIRSDGALFSWGINAAGQLGFSDRVHRSSPTQVGASSWTQISIGTSNVLALRNDGGLFAWGVNTNGKLGTNDAITRSSPVQVGSSSWLQVSTGDNASIGLRLDGGLFNWGLNTSGQLGDLTTVTKSSPIQLGTSSWSFVITGQSSMFGILSDGKLFSWGGGTNGRLGLNDQLHRSSPTQVGTSSWSFISAGDQSTYGVRSDGSLYAWGINNVGQLGDGTVVQRLSPVQVGTSSWIIANSGKTPGAITNYVVALRNDGRLFAWGNNASSQLGNSRFINQSSPIALANINDSWTNIMAGLSHTVAIRNDKILFTWGGNAQGQLGTNDVVLRSAPVQIGSSSWTSVFAGSTHTVAITTSGALFTWGGNSNGELGISTTTNRSSPVQIGTNSWSVVSADAGFTGAIRSDNLLYTWGLNSSGQLGVTTLKSMSSPMVVSALINDSFSQISAGGTHSAAIRSDGLLTTWGLNTSGQVGDTTVVSRSSPVQLISSTQDGYYSIYFNGTTDYLDTPSSTAFALSTNDFTLECWIYPTAWTNNNGTILDFRVSGGGDSQVKPRIWLTGGTLAYYVSGSNQITTTLSSLNTWYHIAVVRTSGLTNLYVDGTLVGATYADANDYGTTAQDCVIGQTGDNRSLATGYFAGYISNLRIVYDQGLYNSSPFAVSTTPLTTTSQGATAGNVSLLTAQSNTIRDNSTNNFVMTINGSAATSTSMPFDAPAGMSTSYIQVSAGDNFTYGVQSDATLYVWGNNASGQLGTVDTISRSSPTQLSADTYTEVHAGGAHGLAIRANDVLYAWGSNSAGQIGNTKGVASYSSPVFIKSVNDSWTQVIAGSGMIGLRNDNILFTWGLNSNGQLGQNDLAHRSAPVQLGSAVDGYYSIYSSGSSVGWLQIPHNTALTFGTGTFTIEAFVYLNNYNSQNSIISKMATNNLNAGGSMLFATVQTTGRLFAQVSTRPYFTTTGPIIPLTSWTHIAITRDASNTLTFYVNGEPNNMGTWTENIYGTGDVRIGRDRGGQTNYLNGYISNVRYFKGVVVYTSQFTPPTSPLTAIANTALLTAQSSTPKDNSANNWTVSANGGITFLPTYPSQFTAPPIAVQSWTTIGSSGNHAGAIDSTNNQLYAWGRNTSGEVGNTKGNDNFSSPTFVKGINDSWTVLGLTSTTSHSAAIRSDNLLYTWGLNAAGQLGLLDTTTRSDPTRVGSSSWTNVLAGASHTTGISSNGLFAWGNNAGGQLGLEDVIHRSSPVQVGTSSWTLLANGNTTSLALKSNGNLFAWGTNSIAGELGITRLGSTSSPALIKTINDSWTNIAAGNAAHILAIRNDGALFVWGGNANGELGLDDAVLRSTPVQLGTSSWSVVGVGTSLSAAIKAGDKSLWAWGNNTNGELGISDRVHRSSPIQIGTFSYTSVSTKVNNLIASRTDGILFTWGLGTAGQLGQLDIISRSSPTQLGTTGAIFNISAAYSSPVQIGTSSWTQVSAGNNYNMVVRSDNVLFAWGSIQGGGQISPTLTNQGYSATTVSAGSSHFGFVRRA